MFYSLPLRLTCDLQPLYGYVWMFFSLAIFLSRISLVQNNYCFALDAWWHSSNLRSGSIFEQPWQWQHKQLNKKAIGLISKTKNLNVHTIWWISLPPLYDYAVKHDRNGNAMVTLICTIVASSIANIATLNLFLTFIHLQLQVQTLTLHHSYIFFVMFPLVFKSSL